VTTAHEPRRGPDAHPSAEDLSSLAEGAQPGAEGVAGHLLDCQACQDEVDAISDLLVAFEEFEAPAIPHDVAIRIDAALARESAARSGESESAARTRAGARPSRRRWVLGSGLAALALVAGSLTLMIKMGSDGRAASTSAGPVAVNGLATGATDALPQYGVNNSLHAPSRLSSTSPLARWAEEVLRFSGAQASVAEGDSSCAFDPQFAGHKPLAVSAGTYEGTPAVLVIYAYGGDDSAVYALAYATPCGASNYRLLASGVVAK
jgi:hypothetical protein